MKPSRSMLFCLSWRIQKKTKIHKVMIEINVAYMLDISKGNKNGKEMKWAMGIVIHTKLSSHSGN